jgi:membrane protein DedA with SNARE-associated domain
MKISLLLAAACSAASGIGMIMASGTLAGVFVGLGALYCAGYCAGTAVLLFTKDLRAIQGRDY